MAVFFEVGHDAVVGDKVVTAVAQLKWLDKDHVDVDIVQEHDVVVTATGAGRESTHVIGVELDDRFYLDIEFL